MTLAKYLCPPPPMNSQTELGVGWGVKTGGLAGNQTQILLQLNRKENVLPPESSSSQSSQWNFRGSSRKFIRRSFFYAVIFIPSQTTACCCCYHLFFCIFFWLRLCWAWISPEATWFFTQALSRMTHVTQETPRREPRPGGTFIPEHHGKSLIKLRQSPNQGWGHKDPREMLQAFPEGRNLRQDSREKDDCSTSQDHYGLHAFNVDRQTSDITGPLTNVYEENLSSVQSNKLQQIKGVLNCWRTKSNI